MDTASIYTIIITLITVLGSTSAWRFYERRVSKKERAEDYMKDDCRERIAKLEILLENASKEKELMRKEILALTSNVAELNVKVEFLEKENKELNRELEIKKRQKSKSPPKPRKKK